MPLFKYKGKTLNGKAVEGQLRAPNQNDLEYRLSEDGIILDTYSSQSLNILARLHALFKKTEITRLTRQMSVLISSGISVVEALDALEEQIEDRKLLQVYRGVRDSIVGGNTIADSFGQYPAYFNEIYTSLLESGEISGNLDKSLERIAEYREKAEVINNKIKSALTYPAVVILVAFGVIALLVTYIIPIFSTMYANFGAELPSLTQYVIDTSAFIKSHILLISIFLTTMVVLIVFGLNTRTARMMGGNLALKIPIFKNLFLNILSSRFSRTMGVLLSSGIKLIDAVEVSSKTVGNAYATEKLSLVSIRLSEGKPLADSLSETKLFPKTIIKMSSAGEATGNLGGIFLKSAEFYEKQVDIGVSAVNSLIEPLVIVFLGIFIAFILVAMYLPLFDLVGQLGM